MLNNLNTKQYKFLSIPEQMPIYCKFISSLIIILFSCTKCYSGYTVPKKSTTLYQNIDKHTTSVVYKNDELLNDSSKVNNTNVPPKRAKEENWQGKSSVIFGIAGWILSLLIGIVWVYFFFSLPTIILGIKGLRSYKKHKLLALFGLVLGIMLLVAFLYIPAMVIFG